MAAGEARRSALNPMSSLGELVVAAAADRPESTAIVDGERAVTYAELDAASSRVADLLVCSGVEVGDPVAIHLPKSADAIVAMYGVLKAGGAYVPVDPSWPDERRRSVLEDSGASVAVWSGATTVVDGVERVHTALLPGGPPESGSTRVRILGPDAIASARTTSPARPISPDHPAYILYTSGSTGRPKGVVITHSGALAFVGWAAREFALASSDRVSSHAPLHFDLSIFDVFASARGGACVVLVPKTAMVLPAEAARFVETAGITVWYSVPSALVMMIERGNLDHRDLRGLRAVLFAGEVMPLKYLQRLRDTVPHARLSNLYGPTETNVCTFFDVPRAPVTLDEVAPIGRPTPGTELLVVRDDGSPAPTGDPGELLVAGPTVMAGYHNDVESTSRAFVPDPRPGRTGRLYRTGDVVEEGTDGQLRFRGRRDDQIKSRGFRIELGEIERALEVHAAVVECAAVAVPDEQVTARVWAYVVVTDDVETHELVRACGHRLPGHMIPERFVVVPSLPRTPNGKVDRSALVESTDEGPE